MKNFEINSSLKKNPNFKKKLWQEMKEKILGKKYNLSLVFIGDKKSKSLNKKFRNKNYPANILSFPLEPDVGEIFINWPYVLKESKKWERTPENFINFLFIHGLAHLKGYDHISEKDAEKMERFEKKIRKKFNI